MAKSIVNNKKYNNLVRLLKKHGDLRCVHKVDHGFYISDLYLNEDYKLRLSCTDLISLTDLTKKSGVSDYELIKDKYTTLKDLEACINTDIYEIDDNTFNEHADYVLEYVDFSKLPTRNYYKGVIDFFDGKEKNTTNEFFFLGTNDHI